MRLEGRFCLTVHMCLKSCFPVDLSTKNIIVFLFRSGLKLGLVQDLTMFCYLTTFIYLKLKVCPFFCTIDYCKVLHISLFSVGTYHVHQLNLD